MGDEKKKASRSPLAAAVYSAPVDGSDGHRSLETVTPLSMEAEWDPYVQRKQHGVGLQPIVVRKGLSRIHSEQASSVSVLSDNVAPFGRAWLQGVLRNDRTPLNTPYTPQLMKLHLKRHEEYDERDEYDERPGKQLVTTVKSKIVLVMQPVHKIRSAVEHVVSIVVPACIQGTALFAKVYYARATVDRVALYRRGLRTLRDASEPNGYRTQHLHVTDLDFWYCGSVCALTHAEPPYA
ncbi:hypothetical protein ON010_g11434 [Phytophthora cinnamomi]|nr:hypothetical protein ON010_g11434 [Phytophthora cinnamomi]